MVDRETFPLVLVERAFLVGGLLARLLALDYVVGLVLRCIELLAAKVNSFSFFSTTLPEVLPCDVFQLTLVPLLYAISPACHPCAARTTPYWAAGIHTRIPPGPRLPHRKYGTRSTEICCDAPDASAPATG